MPSTSSCPPAGMACSGRIGEGSAIRSRIAVTALLAPDMASPAMPPIKPRAPVVAAKPRKRRLSIPSAASLWGRRLSVAAIQRRSLAVPARRTSTPTAAPSNVGTGPISGCGCCRVSTANTATAAATPRRTEPSGGRRDSSQPARAEPTVMATPRITKSATLSPVPKTAIIKSFSQCGARSIASCPVATSGEESPPSNADASSAVPSRASTAMMPASAGSKVLRTLSPHAPRA